MSVRRKSLVKASLVVAFTLLVSGVIQGCNSPEGMSEDPTISAQEPAAVLGPEARVYADPNGPAARWVAENPGHPAASKIKGYIASRGAAQPLLMPTSELREHVRTVVDAAGAQGSRPLFVADIFGSVGCDGDGYQEWFAELAGGIADRPASVVLRDSSCVSASLRRQVMTAGVDALRTRSLQTQVMLDATNLVSDPRGAAETMAGWSVAEVDGIAINLGQYRDGITVQRIATDLRTALREATGRNDLYVVADSRNEARDVPPEACNPKNARIGPEIVASDDPAKVVLLRLTIPGTSDGPCGMASHSIKGEFVPEIAEALLNSRR